MAARSATLIEAPMLLLLASARGSSMLAAPMLLLLAGARGSSYSYAYGNCSYATESCPYRADGYCDAPEYCDCDVWDCDPCAAHLTCESCVADDGCVFCETEQICASEAPPPSYFADAGRTVSCPTYATTCETGVAAAPDPYYEAEAWYLEMINAPAAWASAWARGVTGAGVRIQVNDDGVDDGHPDLAKVSASESCVISAPADADSEHGTHCAALAAASSNAHCGVGVAPDATLASCNVFNGSAEVADDSYLYAFDNDVSSNSWGIDACVLSEQSAGAACPFAAGSEPCAACGSDDWRAGALDDACADAVVYVFAAGNEYGSGDDVNYEGYLNSRYTISVGAVGKLQKHASYSSVGAPVTIAAPGGDEEFVHNMVTAFPVASGRADDCGDATVGTSFATPLVAGVVALMLEANPELGWRDVQGIFANTSKQVDADDDDWATNAAGVTHSYKYGFGLVDADAAVAAAGDWDPYPREFARAVKTAVRAPIVDCANGTETWVSSELGPVNASATAVVEHVAVLLTVEHPYRGDLRVELERNGVTSTLAWERPEGGKRFSDWKFTTLRHWGERLDDGNFTLRVADMREGSGPNGTNASSSSYYYGDDYDDDGDDDGVLVSWTLVVYGHDYAASAPAPVGDDDDDDEASVVKLAVIVGVVVLVLVVLVAAAAAATRRRAPVEPALGAQTAHPTKDAVQNPVTTP
ncbi:serine-type endopeptidase [Aureococcus anophagefferens]|nr:serine-type endopeptidase [Aureococcus anophagefferens]